MTVEANGLTLPVPPQAISAEQAVLGAMLMSPAVADEISEKLQASDFYRPVHATIFGAILAVAAAGEPPDSMMVAKRLDEDGNLQRTGGVVYLSELMEAVPTAANGGWYATIVAEKAARRRLLEAGTKIAQLALSAGDLAEVREQAATAAYAATTDRRDRALIESVGDLVGPTLKHIDDISAGRVEPGIPTGLTDFDRLTGGNKPGELIIPAGRTAMGKSVLTQNWVLHAVRHTMEPGLLFSVEMSKEMMMQRLLSEISRVPLHVIIDGHPNDDERTKLRTAEQELLSLPLYFVDNVRTTQGIRAYTRRFSQRIAPPVVVGVDYLQRLQSVGRPRDRHEVVGEFADHLKDQAQDMNHVVIAPCQLNRGPESRAGREANKPKLSDLRESGNLEQTADKVVLIYRPDYYDKESNRSGEADLIVAKHRNGPTDTIIVAAQLWIQRFRDMKILGTPEPATWE